MQLTQSGYTIPKPCLTPAQYKKMQKDLTIQPKTIGGPIYGKLPSFVAYCQTPTKWVVPKYYGLREFGLPSVLPPLAWASIAPAPGLVFTGGLRPTQEPVVEAFLTACQQTETGGGGILVLPCAFGKTTIACYLMSQQYQMNPMRGGGVNGRVLVIVHMEFLMTQWLERIQQFLPNAKVGKIQGEIMEVEGKDVVLAMLKSLSEKVYPKSLFAGFGMVICDEVHHFSSRTFSQSLFQVAPKITLGLSATPERLDGTSHLFRDFLGPNIIEITPPQGTHAFEIRKITYSHCDPEYNKIIKDYMGNTQNSCMLSKISQFAPRTEFILRVIQDYLQEDPTTQLMVIGHNLAPLEYMQQRLPELGVLSVGKYVGGAKEKKHLKAASEKQVILATYKMASEGLDIPTLSSMIMTSSKKDIIQVIGRITRVKRPKYVVYDIVDTHPCFQNQWRQRRAYYRSQGFCIYETTNHTYTGHWPPSNKEEDDEEAEEEEEEEGKAVVCMIPL